MSWSCFHGFCGIVLCVHSSLQLSHMCLLNLNCVFAVVWVSVFVCAPLIFLAVLWGGGWADQERGGRGTGPTPENHKNIGFRSNSGPDPLKNHKAAEPAFNV